MSQATGTRGQKQKACFGSMHLPNRNCATGSATVSRATSLVCTVMAVSSKANFPQIVFYREFEGTTDLTGYSHDINFHTMLLQTYSANGSSVSDKNGTKSSDAGFIRCVEN